MSPADLDPAIDALHQAEAFDPVTVGVILGILSSYGIWWLITRR